MVGIEEVEISEMTVREIFDLGMSRPDILREYIEKHVIHFIITVPFVHVVRYIYLLLAYVLVIYWHYQITLTLFDYLINGEIIYMVWTIFKFPSVYTSFVLNLVYRVVGLDLHARCLNWIDPKIIIVFPPFFFSLLYIYS